MEEVKTKISYENELAGRLILHLFNKSTLTTNRLSIPAIYGADFDMKSDPTYFMHIHQFENNFIGN